jgi:hypothetical protein
MRQSDVRILARWGLAVGVPVVIAVVLTAAGVISKPLGVLIGLAVIFGYWIAAALTLRRGGSKPHAARGESE